MTVEQLEREAERLSADENELFEYLWDSAREMLEQGKSREEVVHVLQSVYRHLGETGMGDAQDEVVEVLNALAGYASPSARL